MTPTHRIETVLIEDGKLSLDQLPFRAGQSVEVLVLPVATPVTQAISIRGAVLRYESPSEPVADADWDVLQ